MENMIYAGIVLYNPGMIRLKENISLIIGQVDKVVLVDNGSKNMDEVENLLTQWDNIELVKNEKNEGIALALNQIIEFGKKNGFAWGVTLDQDSVTDEHLIKNYLNFLQKHEIDKIGCLTCNIIDRNFKLHHEYRKDIEYKEIEYCITSGTLMNVEATIAVGGFDSSMFIDKVDCDICINLRRHGYKIIQIDYDGLLHEVGHARQINLGFRKWEMYNHSPFRRYYMCRNTSYLLKKYHDEYVLKMFFRELFHTILVFVFEEKKVEKFAEGIKGFVDGMFNC